MVRWPWTYTWKEVVVIVAASILGIGAMLVAFEGFVLLVGLVGGWL